MLANSGTRTNSAASRGQTLGASEGFGPIEVRAQWTRPLVVFSWTGRGCNWKEVEKIYFKAALAQAAAF